MIKNGLFIASVGFIIFVVGAISPDMELQSIPLLILAVGLVALGGIVFFAGYKKDKDTKKEKDLERVEDKQDESE